MEVTPWGRLGPMNVEYLEYMMGFPIGYTALNTSGMMESRNA